jgi:hypothetical protein
MDDTRKDGDAEDDLLGAILKAEDNWRVERALVGLGRLLPRRARRCVPDQTMVEDYLKGDVAEVKRRGETRG